MTFPQTRMRRLRYNSTLRHILKETKLDPANFVLPLFIHHNPKTKNPIQSMPGHYQLGLDSLKTEIDEIVALGLSSILLFGLPESKDPTGSAAWQDTGIIQRAIKEIKQQAPHLLVIADVCFCEYTDHGHCGVVINHRGETHIDNDATLDLLGKQAVSLAQAGCDVIAPSGNLDGMVAAIREALDHAGFFDIPILSYAIKYASSLYGPFREAAEGAPKFGNRESYQMDFCNIDECLREVELDIAEGADMLMVKPATFYLDIIQKIKTNFPGFPLAAYQVSGEYAMLHAAAEKGWLDLNKMMVESLIGIKRAGADIIITYFAKDIVRLLNGGV